jgi:protein involved in polysaccharide export with SLBB domain
LLTLRFHMRTIVPALLIFLLVACSSVTPQPQTIGVSVLGWVKNPGNYTLRAHASIVEALEAAGGFRDFGHSRTLTVVRTTDGQERRFAVRLHSIEGKPQADFELIDGDKVYAHEALL